MNNPFRDAFIAGFEAGVNAIDAFGEQSTLVEEALLEWVQPPPVSLDPELTRVWCETLARELQSQGITRGGKPYLTRYFAAGWTPYNRRIAPAIYLHHFHASDPIDSVHSHPWAWGMSVILVGGYREIRCDPYSVREYRPGDVNVLHPHTKHRVELLGVECWSLFLAGPYLQPWAFEAMCSDVG